MVRLALIWLRKGGALHRRLTDEFGFVFGRLKHRHCSQRLYYGEHEFSFDDTPCFRSRLHRSSSLSFVYDKFDDRDDYNDVDDDGDVKNFENEKNVIDYNHDDDDEGIDEKAEEFIAKFYQQMKLQHQVSLLEYNEMLHRSIS